MKEIAGICAERPGERYGGRSDSHTGRPAGGDTDEVPLNEVSRRTGDQSALDVDAVEGIPRNQVSVPSACAANLVSGGALDADAVAAVGLRGSRRRWYR